MRVLLAWLIATALPVAAATFEITPADDFERVANALAPGDELVLRGGRYRFDSNITVSVRGTADEPIVIRAADGETPVLSQATSNHNVVDIRSAEHLVVRGLEITGGSHGIRLIDADRITIEACHIHNVGDVAISANAGGGTYEGLRLLRNHIHDTNDTGEGMYLGCNRDACRVANSLIEGNYIHHTNGPTVNQGDGIEIKEGSYGNVVRDNVIHDTNYPGILTYSTVGNGPPNVIEGNVVWGSNDNTIQVAADAVIRNNIVLGNVAFQSHQNGSPSNIELVHNTIVNTGHAVNVRNVSGPVLIANNAIYAQGGAIRLISGQIGLVTVVGNVGAGGATGGHGFTFGLGIERDLAGARYQDAPPIDVYPAAGGALLDAADPAFAVATDFNGTSRAGTLTVGAYAFDSMGNPGQALQAGFKRPTAPRSPTNLGVVAVGKREVVLLVPASLR